MNYLFALCLLVSSLAGAQAQENIPENDPEIYRQEVDQLNERYTDFFSRDEEIRRYYRAINQGIPDVKSERKADRAEADRARREFIAERKGKPDTAPLEAEFEAEKRADQRQHERYRKDYVGQRTQLRRISQSARKIPENRDAGLED